MPKCDEMCRKCGTDTGVCLVYKTCSDCKKMTAREEALEVRVIQNSDGSITMDGDSALIHKIRKALSPPPDEVMGLINMRGEVIEVLYTIVQLLLEDMPDNYQNENITGLLERAYELQNHHIQGRGK